MRYLNIIFYFIFPVTMLAQWETQISGTTENLRCIYFLNPVTGYAAGENGNMLRTANGGNIWSNVSTGITQNINSIYFFNAASGIACANEGVVIVTTNGGTNWSSASSGVTDNLYSISFVNSRGVCAGSGGTLLYSTNSGLNWTIAENGFLSTYYGAYMYSDNFAFAGGVNTIFQPLFAKSSNGGANWSFSVFYLKSNEGNLSGVAFITENEGFASSRVFDGQGGISYTSNGGSNWTTQLFPSMLNCIDFYGMNTGYAAGENGLILKTTNKGLNWITQTNPAMSALRSIHFADSLNGFAAGDNGVIIRTSNGGLSFINDPGESNPDSYYLLQNFPNPFNPVTVIRYSLSENHFITLKVFDAIGNEVASLVNEKQSAGIYSVTFDGSGLSSGIYYYKIESGDFLDSRKMILLK